jgi:mannosyltransferase OCH1-like enzyme
MNQIIFIIIILGIIILNYNMNKIGIFEYISNNKILKIPKIIWQTHKTKNLPKSSSNAIKRLKKNNPDFEYKFFDNDDCYNYIKNNFNDDVLRAYNKIYPGAGKADIWRLAVILREGGIYIDVDKILTKNAKPFSYLIGENDELIHGRGWHIWGFNAPSTNATICARPNHPVIRMAFNSVIDSILNDKPLKNIGKNSGWARLENYTGSPHLWKALAYYTGNINMKEGVYQHGIRITQDIENQLQQNKDYGDDLHKMNVSHWMSQPVFVDDVDVEDFENLKSNPKILLLIRSYNRPEYLSKTLKSLEKSDIDLCFKKFIYDDNSNKTTLDILQKYEKDYEIIYNDTNYKQKSMVKFLNLIQNKNLNFDYICYVDNDVKVKYNFIQTCFKTFELIKKEQNLSNNKILLTGFNSNRTHKKMNTFDKYIEKQSIGGIHIFFHKSLLNDIKLWWDKNEDWGICDGLKNIGGRIFCTKPSIVEHIGVNGYNSHGDDNYDKSIDF